MDANTLTRRLVGIAGMFPHGVEDMTALCTGPDLVREYGSPHTRWGVHANTASRLHVMYGHILGAGFEFAGHGHFSVAFRHPDTPGVVYKLSMRTDDAYAAYALWVRASEPNPHAPVIYDIQRGDNAIAFALKEYVPLHVAKLRGQVSYYFDVYKLEDVARGRRTVGVMSMVYPYPPALLKFASSVGDYFKGAARVDIHVENVMYDPDTGNIIITDPVSFNNYS